MNQYVHLHEISFRIKCEHWMGILTYEKKKLSYFYSFKLFCGSCRYKIFYNPRYNKNHKTTWIILSSFYILLGITTPYLHFQRYKHFIDFCYNLKIYFAKNETGEPTDWTQCQEIAGNTVPEAVRCKRRVLHPSKQQGIALNNMYEITKLCAKNLPINSKEGVYTHCHNSKSIITLPSLQDRERKIEIRLHESGITSEDLIYPTTRLNTPKSELILCCYIIRSSTSRCEGTSLCEAQP
jgi:hypothetical protein